MAEIDVINLQRKVKIRPGDFIPFASQCRSISEVEKNSFSVTFVSDRKMRQLNKQFRDKNSTTDVLSFQYEPDEFMSNKLQFVGEETENVRLEENEYLGDIVISAEQAERQAKENGLTLENEIKQLILHGLLHLCGYDHETDNGEMNARELELRETLQI